MGLMKSRLIHTYITYIQLNIVEILLEVPLQVFGMFYFQSKCLPEIYENMYITGKTYEISRFVFLHKDNFSTF